MKIIVPKSSFANLVLSEQKYSSGKKYRFLKYLLEVRINNDILIENFLTGQLILLNKSEYPEDLTCQNSEIFEFLINNWFLVSEDNDDKVLCFLLNSFQKSIAHNNKIITHYTILPTTDCNARCFYCYELGIKKMNMTNQTATMIAKFMIDSAKSNPITIQWFGGEPLYNIQPINIISKILKDQGINFTSRIITNGYLFDSKIIKDATSLWNMNMAQITLDGTEKIYNKYKAYIYKNDSSPFRRVIDNIRSLIENKIRVNIRINLDKHNESNLYDLVNYIYDNIGPSHFLNVYTYPLYERHCLNGSARTIEEKEYIFSKLYNLECFLYEKGLKIVKPINNKIKTNLCIADHDNAVVIRPDGLIVKCDHELETDYIGDIYNGVQFGSNIISNWKTHIEHEDKCENCSIYPVCQKLKKCPENSNIPCVESERKYKLLKRKWAILEAYYQSQG